MSSREHLITRPTSRILLVNPLDQVLLFTTGEQDEETGRPFWFTPGGGLEPGESHEEAGRRELREETGLDAPMGPCIWLRSHTWYWAPNDAWIQSVERYFLVRAGSIEVSLDELDLIVGPAHQGPPLVVTRGNHGLAGRVCAASAREAARANPVR